MQLDTWKEIFENGSYDEKICTLYDCEPHNLKFYKQRYLNSLEAFKNQFGIMQPVALFSAPGRTEIGGNHTDHQHGKVLAGSVNLDVIAVAGTNHSTTVRLSSQGYPLQEIDVTDLAPKEKEYGTTAGLIRGVLARFQQMGHQVSGFNAYLTSNVLKGSGLSSSAAFEVMIGTILNHFFCEDKVDPIEIAKIGQYTENMYFGKPCGLMDQMASSIGGIIAIDFADIQNPIIKQVQFDFSKTKHALCIIDTGGNHANLTNAYASIPQEMKAVANYFGKEVLQQVPQHLFLQKIQELREKVGDRAVLRAMHFYEENKRVDQQVEALEQNDFERFKKLIRRSGRSSYMYLQNIYNCETPALQEVSVALMLCEQILGTKGAYRVHGGGFAGTIQAFVPHTTLLEFTEKIENVFGKGSCHILSIRPFGGVVI